MLEPEGVSFNPATLNSMHLKMCKFGLVWQYAALIQNLRYQSSVSKHQFKSQLFGLPIQLSSQAPAKTAEADLSSWGPALLRESSIDFLAPPDMIAAVILGANQ